MGLEQLQKKSASKISLTQVLAVCGCPSIYGWLLVGMAKRSRLTAVQDGRACVPRRKKDTLRASMRTHYVSGLRAPTAFKNGALRYRQLYAGRSDGPEVFLPGQGLPRTEPPKNELLQDVFCVLTLSPFVPSRVLSSGFPCRRRIKGYRASGRQRRYLCSSGTEP